MWSSSNPAILISCNTMIKDVLQKIHNTHRGKEQIVLTNIKLIKAFLICLLEEAAGELVKSGLKLPLALKLQREVRFLKA